MSSKTKLLSTIALLVFALAIAIFFIFRNDNPIKNVLTAEQLSRFEEGMFYRTIVSSTVQGQVEDRDWGVGKKITLIHEGETDFVREVKSVTEDHTEVVVGLQVLTARDLEVKLALDDVDLHLPPAVGILGRGARKILLPGPEGIAIDIATDRAAEWLKSDINRQKVLSRINFAVKGMTGQGLEEHLLEAKLQPLEAYEGLTAEYTYEAGEGLVDFQTKATLSKEREDRVKNFSVYSEAYLLPDTDPNGQDEWDVDVKTIAHLLAPSNDLDVSGTLTLKRDSTYGDETRLKIVKGKVVFSGSTDKNQVLGTWAARGSLYYNLKTHSIVEGNLTGEVSLERKSTDHVLFEKNFKTKPSYRIIIKGYATKDPTEARKEITGEKTER
ncbi:MAG: hypothetical protein HN570_10155 [Verrucomicrobia bacterium]|nr:hypothetical protein [Verrucomicrobiota bacterium]MBT7971352.1 hypothetical protein [Verrucomicrobiota bacterium]